MRVLNGPGAHATGRSEASAEISSLIEGGNDRLRAVYPRPRLSAHGRWRTRCRFWRARRRLSALDRSATLVFRNDEGGDGGTVTTVTFEERGADTLVVMHDLYSSKEALDRAIASGSTSGFGEAFEQLDELLVTVGVRLGRPRL